jgi:hypothetical protein
MTIDNLTVGLAMFYPEPPKTKSLRDYIENTAMVSDSFPVYWYSEVKTG